MCSWRQNKLSHEANNSWKYTLNIIIWMSCVWNYLTWTERSSHSKKLEEEMSSELFWLPNSASWTLRKLSQAPLVCGSKSAPLKERFCYHGNKHVVTNSIKRPCLLKVNTKCTVVVCAVLKTVSALCSAVMIITFHYEPSKCNANCVSHDFLWDKDR